MERDELCAMKGRALMQALCDGHPIDPAALDGWEYRGVALGLPRFIERLSWKTFQKTFHRDPATGALRGWNVRIEQRGLDAASVPMRRGDVPRTFGHYVVVPTAGHRLRWPVEQGLLIDYGLGGNRALDPMRWMRDPLVAVNRGSTELLLGWTYVELGFARLGTPSFFTLERERPITHVPDPPRPA
jgi:hypothetical protein